MRMGALSAGMSACDIYTHYEADNLQSLADDIINQHTKDSAILIKASHKIGLDRLLTRFKGRL